METIALALIMLLALYIIEEIVSVKKTTKVIVDRLCKKYYILEKVTLKEELLERHYNTEEIINIELWLNDLSVKSQEAEMVERAIELVATKLMREFDKENDILYDAEKNLFYIHQYKMFAILENYKITKKLDIPDKNTLIHYFKENMKQGNGLIVDMNRATKINGRCTRCIVLDLNKISDYIKIDLMTITRG